MKTQMRNFVWDLVVSTLFVSASAWAVNTIRAPEPATTKAALHAPPACHASVLRWPKEAEPDRSEMAPPQAVP